jgi:hypothetical protein
LYHQNNWAYLIPKAEFAYNNNNHSAIGVLPFKANYRCNPTYGGITSSKQCILAVEEHLNRLSEGQEEIKECMAEAQELMKRQFNQHVQETPTWEVGDRFWLDSREISTIRPSPKLGHWWLGPFHIPKVISPSTYKLTLPASMQGVHPTFHVSRLRKHHPDKIEHRKTNTPSLIQVNGEEEWEVEEVLDKRRRGKGVQYLVSWKQFGPGQNLWEPEAHLEHC